MLGCTVDELGQRMSAEEFTQWAVFLKEEGLAPGCHAIDRAEVLAALHNGACVPPSGSKAWRAADFLSRAPWSQSSAAKTAPKSADLRAQIKHMNAVFGAGAFD